VGGEQGRHNPRLEAHGSEAAEKTRCSRRGVQAGTGTQWDWELNSPGGRTIRGADPRKKKSENRYGRKGNTQRPQNPEGNENLERSRRAMWYCLAANEGSPVGKEGHLQLQLKIMAHTSTEVCPGKNTTANFDRSSKLARA